MSKDKRYISQGEGRGIVYECLARIHLENSGHKKSQGNVEDLMQEFADESMESMIANPLLGANPSPRVSKKLKNIIDIKTNEVLQGDNELRLQEAKTELSRAVMHLVSMIMEHVGSFNIKKKDMNNVSTKGLRGDALKEAEKHNTAVIYHNYIKVALYSFLWTIIDVIARTGKKGFVDGFNQGGFKKIGKSAHQSYAFVVPIVHAINKMWNRGGAVINVGGNLKSFFKRPDWALTAISKRELEKGAEKKSKAMPTGLKKKKEEVKEAPEKTQEQMDLEIFEKPIKEGVEELMAEVQNAPKKKIKIEYEPEDFPGSNKIKKMSVRELEDFLHESRQELEEAERKIRAAKNQDERNDRIGDLEVLTFQINAAKKRLEDME